MKRKVYGITCAYIYGLNSELNYNANISKRVWTIKFKGGDVPLPFNTTLETRFCIDPDWAEKDLISVKETFHNCNICNENKVAVIYDVVTGSIIAIGKIKYDCWIKVSNFQSYSFAKLGIKNCSLIPVF